MKKEIILKLEMLLDLYENDAIPKLHKHEVNPCLKLSSRENYLYFVLTCSLNYQRSSPNTWIAALATWNDKETNFVFFPEKVVEVNDEVLRKVLFKHRLALQPVKHIQIWRKLSETFFNNFDSDPRKLLQYADFDVVKILQTIQKDMKKDFPYLSGPKLSNYFLFILLAYSDLKLTNKELLSIIPDTHIMQATQKLGILTADEINPINVEIAWKELLRETRYAPIDFHSLLWNWSRNSFQPEV